MERGSRILPAMFEHTITYIGYVSNFQYKGDAPEWWQVENYNFADKDRVNEHHLRAMSEAGWELVSAVSGHGIEPNAKLVLFWKRPA